MPRRCSCTCASIPIACSETGQSASSGTICCVAVERVATGRRAAAGGGLLWVRKPVSVHKLRCRLDEREVAAGCGVKDVLHAQAPEGSISTFITHPHVLLAGPVDRLMLALAGTLLSTFISLLAILKTESTVNLKKFVSRPRTCSGVSLKCSAKEARDCGDTDTMTVVPFSCGHAGTCLAVGISMCDAWCGQVVAGR